ncbi:MAG TPA: hypothetical protein VNZ22_07415 [Bacillota bacterium]|nr:hypothetical protein [Bacillota bacterium]
MREAGFDYNWQTSMKSKDVFSVAVRIIGLIFLYTALTAVPTILQGFFVPHYFWRNVWSAFLSVGWPLLMAIWMIRGAPLLMRLAYSREEKESSTATTPVRDKLL